LHEGLKDRLADSVDGVHGGPALPLRPRRSRVDGGEEIRPRPIRIGQELRRRLTDVAYPERIDEAGERDLARGADRGEKVADLLFSVPFPSLELDLAVVRLEGEDARGLLDNPRLCEGYDLLLAEPVDVERVAGDEVHEVTLFLEGTGELAGAARHR